MAALTRRLLCNTAWRQTVVPSLSSFGNRNYTINATEQQVLSCAKYGGRHCVTLMTGDGVGPEILTHVQEIFRYAGAPIDFETVEINSSTTDAAYLEAALLSVQRNGVALKGNIETKFDDAEFRSMNVALRSRLDLWSNIVWCRSFKGVNARYDDIDIVLIRENTEGEYSSLEHESVTGVVESLKIITAEKCERIARYAFDFAARNGRKKVTAIHKANIMKLADGLFLESCRKVSEDYADIKFSDMIIDNASMQMVSRPQQFDVLLMPNLYGNILSSIAAGLVGGAGLVPGMNVGAKYAVFESGTRNSGRSLKGKNIANPTGMLLASCDMLDYLGHHNVGALIRESVLDVIAQPQHQTPDMGGQATTTDVIQAIIDDIKPKTQTRLHSAE
ncbi:hypothetical protein V1264_020088 [Littorina saxatilis]|uniref:Isopropylmalate dehydrogenase-like domain-containing protein n=1 Tax=Littorina saxatilis TaxID=31220 RepID=A0AAN9BBV2_9CAEN